MSNTEYDCGIPGLMSSCKEVVIFDTNGLNNLLDEEKLNALLSCFKSRFCVRISEINIVEIAATSDAARREKLLDLLQSLIPLGGCILPPHEIITEMARCHARYKDRFEWAEVDVRCPELDREIAARTFINSTESADENRLWGRSEDKKFKAIFKDAIEKFPLDIGPEDKLSQVKVIEIAKTEGGPFWLHAASVYERANLIPLPTTEAKSFIQKCPPFHALTLMSCIGQYNALPVAPGHRKLSGAGRADLLMATYLPYCDLFISDDAGVQKDLRVIAEEVKLPVTIIAYQELKERCACASDTERITG